MLVFLDFEASSLAKAGYPIEIGWVWENGETEGHLIRPAPEWTDWDDMAEAMHGIARAQLEREGEPHEQVAARLAEALGDHALYASSPSWDGKWLSVLLRAAGLPRHLLRLRDTEEAFMDAARARLGPGADEGQVEAMVAAARARVETGLVAHRAVADARREWQIWRDIREGAQ